MPPQQPPRSPAPATPTDQELAHAVLDAEKRFNEALKAARSAGLQTMVQIADSFGTLKTTIVRPNG